MYKVREIVYTKLFDTHLPFLAYTIIEGPRGGKYLVDVFNTELIFKGATGNVYMGHPGKIIRAHAIEREIGRYTNKTLMDDDLKLLAKNMGYTPLIRKSGIKIAFSIAEAANAHALPNTTYHVPPIVELSA